MLTTPDPSHKPGSLLDMFRERKDAKITDSTDSSGVASAERRPSLSGSGDDDIVKTVMRKLQKSSSPHVMVVDSPQKGKHRPPDEREVLTSSADASNEGPRQEQEAPPNIFFQNARYSGMAPSPDRMPAHQLLPSTIYFFVRVPDTDAVSLIKPLAPHIVAKMHQAKVVEGRKVQVQQRTR